MMLMMKKEGEEQSKEIAEIIGGIILIMKTEHIERDMNTWVKIGEMMTEHTEREAEWRAW